MAKNEDVNPANQGAPAADIPDLKAKEKERKKAGAAWSGARPGGGSFSGATGGAGSSVARAAASAASATGGAAAGAAQAAGAGWLSSMIASLTATVLGKAILAAGVAMFLGGAGVFGYAMLNGGSGGSGGVGGDLGALTSSMKIRAGGGDRTGYIASNGEIMFDPIKKAAEAKKAEAEKAPEDATAGEPIPEQTADADAGARPGALEHNLSGAKLSSSLGGGFGGKNIFAGNSAAPKFNDSMAKSTIKGAQKGRLSASKSASTGRRVAGGSGQRVKANRAFGQLKVAKGMSMQGAGSTGAEGARSTAGTAFDGDNAGSGNVEGGSGIGNGLVTSPSGSGSGSGGGAPDMTAPTVDNPDVVGMDPNSLAMLGAISEMAKKAGEMKKKAAQLMIAGIILIAVGAALMSTVFGAVIGAVLIGLGGMLIGMSIMMSQMAAMMKGMADSMSSGLAAKTGDINQDNTNKYCIDKAYNEGTDPKNCTPPDSVTEGEKWEADNKKTLNDHQSNSEKDAKTEVKETDDENSKLKAE